jgi:hypothetical protein
MEILVATFAMFSYLFSGAPASASPNNNPYILIQEYQTRQECKIAIAHTDDICTTEPDLYLGTRQYSRVSDRGEVHTDIVCNSISGCPVIKDTCPTCTKSKWYFMNN